MAPMSSGAATQNGFHGVFVDPVSWDRGPWDSKEGGRNAGQKDMDKEQMWGQA